MITPTEEQVEALARVLYEAGGFAFTWDELPPHTQQNYRNLARAALSSSVIGDLIAEALRDAGEAFATGEWSDAFLAFGVVDDTSAAQAVEAWLLNRAESLSPADGTTSERSE